MREKSERQKGINETRSRIRMKEVNRPNAPLLQSKQKWHCLGPGMLRGHWLRLTARRNAISGRPLAKLIARIHYCMTVGVFNMYFAYYLSTRSIGNWPFVWGLFMVAWGCMIGRSRNCPNLAANFEYYPTHT